MRLPESTLTRRNASSAKVWGKFILAIANAQSELDLCNAVANYLPKFIPADRASVTRLVSDGSAFEVFAVNGEKQVLEQGQRLPFDQVSLQAVITTQCSHVFEAHTKSVYFDLVELARQGMVIVVHAPLMISGQAIGSLNVASKTKALDQPDTIELIEQIATLLAMNLERHWLHQQTQVAIKRYRSYANQLGILNEIGRQLSAEITKAGVFDVIARAISQVVNVDRVSYAVPTSDHQGFEVFRFTGNSYLPTDIVIPAANSGLNEVCKTGQPVFFSDLTAQQYSEHAILANFGLKVGWSVPVRVSNQIIGVLNAASSRTDLDGQEQLDLLTTLGGLMGATLERIAMQDEAAVALQELAYRAHYDTLTNLPNRALFSQQLENALAVAQANDQQLAVLFIDLDRFKSVNDTLGHTVGDKLLCVVASQLQQVLSASNTVARLGGDEFVVLLPQVTQLIVAQTAQNLLKMLETPLRVDGHSIFLGGSIGISLFPGNGTTPGTLMKNADIAMYHAKAQGRNNYQFYDTELSTKLKQRITIEHALRGAISNDQLSLVFHPQINLISGKIDGLEALVRWENSPLGPIRPDQFIPVAEDSGLIEALSNWVLDQSLCTIKQLRQHYPHLYVAVNFSAQEFATQTSLLSRIKTALKKHQLPGSVLELEITESVFLQAEENTSQLMKALKNEGVRIAIDDFGTGFSSLSYLVNLPFDTLKIDRSFIQRLGHDPRNDGIVHGTIQIAKSLGMSCVAEGVETLEQLAYLQQQMCQNCQGFLFSKPVPASQLDRLLNQNLYPLLAASSGLLP